MPALTLAKAKENLRKALKARDAVLDGQSWTIGSRQLTRANLKDIDAEITKWIRIVNRLERGGIRVQGAVPIDS